jgi:hypothetical protein
VKKWVLSAILAFATLAVVFWAISPLLIIYVKAISSDISFDVGNRQSMEAAIVQTQSSIREYFREIYGDSVLAVSRLRSPLNNRAQYAPSGHGPRKQAPRGSWCKTLELMGGYRYDRVL